MRKVDMLTICRWIVDAWKELPIKTVVKGFKKCSISNMLDGTEDDILWMDDADNDDDDEREEELDYHDDCITHGSGMLCLMRTMTKKIYIDKYYSFEIFIINF